MAGVYTTYTIIIGVYTESCFQVSDIGVNLVGIKSRPVNKFHFAMIQCEIGICTFYALLLVYSVPSLIMVAGGGFTYCEYFMTFFSISPIDWMLFSDTLPCDNSITSASLGHAPLRIVTDVLLKCHLEKLIIDGIVSQIYLDITPFTSQLYTVLTGNVNEYSQAHLCTPLISTFN